MPDRALTSPDEDWAVAWITQGARQIADMPSEFEARQFAQICILFTDISDVHVLPPIGPLDMPGAAAA